MKKIAMILSWVGGAINIIIGLIGVFMIRHYQNEIYMTDYFAIWLLYSAYVIICVAILIWRDASVSVGKKKLCGVFTLIFASFVGGIVTLFIPDSQIL